MNAILDVQGSHATWFRYTCPECNTDLEEIEDGILKHPEHEGAIFGKGKPIQCSNAGKKFKTPIQTIKLEAA